MSERLQPGLEAAEPTPSNHLIMPDDELRKQLLGQLAGYDSFSSEAEHLRPHQVEAVHRFLETARGIATGNQPNQGMSLLHPTGSGKTVTAAEIIRIVCADTSEDAGRLNVLMLVPGYQVLNQATGNMEEVGVIQSFVPSLSVGEYSGKKKDTGARVTVMNYQALRGARARGDIDAINPALIIADEAHHVIDGSWAEEVEAISQGKLLLGLTATPVYSASRDVRRLFPNVLAQKTLRQGIEEGILAEMRGFLYQGSSKLVVARGRKEYTNEEIFSAIADSKDNYLAAAISAGEVAQGRRGVVSCAPGFDRAHAKIMAKILSLTPVKTDEGQRHIRSAYVDGETHADTLDDIFRKYKQGEIDVLTYVDLLLEGWDSPETEFGVMLRPTKSRVLAEQRIGRIVRPALGKVATLHEIVYEVIGDDQPQQTHLDVLDASEIRQGRYFGRQTSGKRQPYNPSYNGNGHVFDLEKFVVNSGLIAAASESEQEALHSTSVVAGQEAVPYDWPTAQFLANRFGVPREEAEIILKESGITSKTQAIDNVDHVYYSPSAVRVMAKSLKVEELVESDEAPLTLNDLVEHIRDSSYARRVRPQTIKAHMEKAGIEPKMYITKNNQIVRAYDYSDRDIPLVGMGYAKHKKPEQSRQKLTDVPELEFVNWLAKILVNPNDAASPQIRREILAGQSCLIASMKEARDVDPGDYEALAMELSQSGIQPNDQMKNVMAAKKLDFVDLIMHAQRAQAKFVRIAHGR